MSPFLYQGSDELNLYNQNKNCKLINVVKKRSSTNEIIKTVRKYANLSIFVYVEALTYCEFRNKWSLFKRYKYEIEFK